jgi:uncharacterized damage-inducible protein DinB
MSTMLIGQWEQVNEKLATLAEEFPQDKYEFRPSDGVRTFSEVLRHVAFWNHYVANCAFGGNADDTANELSKSEYPTKAKIIGVLKSSAAEVAKVLRDSPAGLEPKTAEMVTSFLEHTSEHYGQLVVYAA